MNHFSSDELIFHKVGNEIMSAGFGINSILLNKGLSPILTFTNHYAGKKDDETSSSSSSSDDEDSSSDEEGNPKQVFRSFKNLAVPLGLYSSNYPSVQHSKNVDTYSHIKDDIYDELLKLSEFNVQQKPKSKKNKLSKKSKTKTYKHNR